MRNLHKAFHITHRYARKRKDSIFWFSLNDLGDDHDDDDANK